MDVIERDLEKGAVDVARLLGWRVFHARPARTSKGWRTPVSYDGMGFPDLCIVGNGRILFRELKVGRNVLSSEQAAWLEALRMAGAGAGGGARDEGGPGGVGGGR